MNRWLLIPLLVVTHAAASWLGYRAADQIHRNDSSWVEHAPARTDFDSVLDGDTVVQHGVAYHVHGIDAAELGPWAKCWAEAALAGKSRSFLDVQLRRTVYTLTEPRTDVAGRMSARFVDKDGYDIADHMHVNGDAALTDQRWDWCGKETPLKPVQGEKPPAGPTLWWPSGHVYDARAND